MKNFIKLKKLTISNNKITVNTIGNILSHNTKLEHLNLSDLLLCLEDFMIIALKMKSILNLRSLDISRNNGHNSSCERTDIVNINSDSVAALFSHIKKLEDLDLSDLGLSSEDFIKIATTLTSMSKLRKLNIINNDIDDSATDAIIALLNHNVDLELLDISDIELDEMNTIKVAKALQKRSKLTKINIRCCDDLTNNAADAIAAILSHNSNLKEIKLEVGECEIEVSEHLSIFVTYKVTTLSKQEAYIVAALLSNCTKLEVLDMSDTDMEGVGAIRVFKSMKNISTLKIFDVSTTYDYGDQAANSIAEVLANNKQLKKIGLCDSDIKPVGAIKIFGGMKNLHNLIKLNVSHNHIADKEAYEDTESLADKLVPIVSQISHLTTKPVTHTAVQYLASVIDHNPNLQQLNIGNIDLDSEQTIVIFKGMKNLTKLTQLDISYSVITNNAANLLASILSHNISLQVLDLSSCSLQTEGATEIFNAIRNHSCLISLNISNNNITNDAANVLASVLSLNITVQNLHLQRCSLQTEGAIKIFNAIRNHVHLTSLSIRDNDDIDRQAVYVLRAVLSSNPRLRCYMPSRIKYLINISE